MPIKAADAGSGTGDVSTVKLCVLPSASMS
jgi:hypothetical protein